VQEVAVDAVELGRLESLLDVERRARLARSAERGRALLEGRTVWNISSTAAGGGVAEMLQTLLAYSRGAQVNSRWLVLDGDAGFFHLTKRVHNMLHGSPGDGGALGDDERRLYEDVISANVETFRPLVRPGDIVLLHDPQTAGLIPRLLPTGAHVVWRCHVGRDTPNEYTDAAWSFLRPYVEEAEAVVFSRQGYAPDWVSPDRLCVIPPSLDPFSAKNGHLPRADVEAALRHAGIVGIAEDHGSLAFVRRDGAPGAVRRHTGLMAGGKAVPGSARIVLQVSRWDALKDMTGVLTGFAAHARDFPPDVHLLLVGPDVSGVADDPEGAEVLADCQAILASQPQEIRSRLHLCSLPMDDIDENAHLVNALQRYATVVVQKSLVEGFGLTVAEAMWKARPVIASRVGGIQDQIVDGESGILLDDPSDLDRFAARLGELLAEPEPAARMATAAQQRVRELFLADRHLVQYVELFGDLMGTSPEADPALR